MTYDLITVGRVNMDLYSLDIGEPFEKARHFEAMVGGSPTNIAISSTRLGMTAVAFTGVGNDRVGDFVLDYLEAEGVIIDWVLRVPDKLTSLALLGVEPPDRFPLSFYRDDPADIYLEISDAQRLPWDETTALLVSGNALSRGSCAEAARWCAAHASSIGLTVFMDLDLRPTEWRDPAAYGAGIGSALGQVDVLLGTEEELWAALASGESSWADLANLSPDQYQQVDRSVSALVADGAGPRTVVIKRGPDGVTVVRRGEERLDVPGFPVEVLNTVGAGDAFAGGLIARRINGDEWVSAARYANACGAIEVTRHGCAGAFPTHAEVAAFLEERGVVGDADG